MTEEADGELQIVDGTHVVVDDHKVEFPIVPAEDTRVACPDGGYINVNFGDDKDKILLSIDDNSITRFYRSFLEYDADRNACAVAVDITKEAQTVTWCIIGSENFTVQTANLADFVSWFQGKSYKNLLRALKLPKPTNAGKPQVSA